MQALQLTASFIRLRMAQHAVSLVSPSSGSASVNKVNKKGFRDDTLSGTPLKCNVREPR